MLDDLDEGPAARGRPGVLQRLGRPARVHDRRHRRRRVRRRDRLARRVRLHRSREHGVRGAAPARRRQVPAGRRAWRTRRCSRPPGRSCSSSGRTCRPTRTSSSTSSARGSSTRRSSGTRTTTASSPTTCSTATRAPDDALHRGHGQEDRRGGQPLHRRRPQGAREVAGVDERRSAVPPALPKVGEAGRRRRGVSARQPASLYSHSIRARDKASAVASNVRIELSQLAPSPRPDG